MINKKLLISLCCLLLQLSIPSQTLPDDSVFIENDAETSEGHYGIWYGCEGGVDRNKIIKPMVDELVR
ncbi:hypothetical protein JYU20_01295 [Bacteroidales bacterium AH-315-I05]|nr:hypothetical protein [Bacteroidales bacterium AH-315-I05]